MKVKSGFILRKVCDNYAVIAVGQRTKTFKGVMTLNDSGKLLWELLSKGCEKSEMIDKILSEYDVSKERAKQDVDSFIEKLVNADVIED